MFCRGMIPLAMVSLVTLLLGYVMERLWYVRLLGLVGLLTASLWTPWLLASWRMRSNELLFRWDLRNTHMAPELRGPNPSYDRVGGDKKRDCLCLSRRVHASTNHSQGGCASHTL